MVDHPKLQEALDRFLQNNYDDFALKRRALLQRSKIVLETLLEELRKQEALFDFENVSSSTFFEIKSSNTVEVFLSLKHFDASKEGLSIEDGQTPLGFAIAKINGKKTKWDEWCVISNSGKKFLSSRIINEKLVERIGSMSKLDKLHFKDFTARLERSPSAEHAVTLKLSGNGLEDYYLNILPTIPCPGRWTFSAHAWQQEESYWPSKKMKEEAIADGVQLVGRSSRTKSPYHWQLAFLQPMKRFLTDTSGCRHKCLMIMRIILENRPGLQRGISGIHFEIVMLHLFKKYPAATFWREDKFSQRFLDLVQELQVCVKQKELADFFLPELNSFKELRKSATDAWEKELKALHQNPIEYLNSVESIHQNTAL